MLSRELAGKRKKEFINYLHMEQGSLNELDTQFELPKRPGYLAQDSCTMLDRRVERIDKILSGLIHHQKSNGVKRVVVRP
jgi:four helix bundle protein